MENLIVQIHQRAEVAVTIGRRAIRARTEAVLLEVPAPFATLFVAAFKTTRAEIFRTFLTAAITAFAIVLFKGTPGEILSVLAPIIHVKPALLSAWRVGGRARRFKRGKKAKPTPRMFTPS
ncbi:hypothetical protein [Mailhella sp.]|uniref:hypothetical protein n=1 Tax=Mailhella sp. TaxID=1981029 RepID=UPI003AB6A9DE